MKTKLLLTLLLFGTFLKAQEVPELVTDRPDQTESSSVVQHKSLQIETGFVLGNNESEATKEKSIAYNTTLLRYGLLKNLELRIGLEYFEEKNEPLQMDTSFSVRGLSPLYAGFKVFILEENAWVPEMAFLSGLKLPAFAHKEFKPSNTAASMRFAFSHTLSDKVSVGYNLGAEWDGETAVPEYFYSLAFGFSLLEKLGTYAEVFGFMPEEGESSHLIDAGFTYLILTNLQFDISGGVGLNDEAIDNYFSAGFSYRLSI